MVTDERLRHGAAVFVGGMLGGGARIALSTTLNSGELPWGTLAANISGALFLGYLLTRLLRAAGDSVLLPLLCTGVLGGYTTFSTFSLETWELLREDRLVLAAAYSIGSVVLGLGAAAAGVRAAGARA